MNGQPTAVKDENAAHPISGEWRPMLGQVVKAIAAGDYQLECGVAGVQPVPSDIAAQIETYISKYGETLVDLPEQAWETSCAQWMGNHWDVLIDLWTEGEGPSDLVLFGKMEEVQGSPTYTIGMVYVP